MKKVYVSVSTDPIVAKNLSDEIIKYAKQAQDFGADFLHCDVMDGKFVSSKTYNHNVLEQIESNTLIPLDVHLMIDQPWKEIENYKKAGANFLTVHYESFLKNGKLKTNLLTKTLKQIKKEKMLCGISINPQTTVDKIKNFLHLCDLVLVMSVEPGKSGQKFIEDTYEKVKELESYKKDGLNFKIEVDGGIIPEISKKLIDLGAEIIVSGSYIYNSENKNQAIKLLKNN